MTNTTEQPIHAICSAIDSDGSTAEQIAKIVDLPPHEVSAVLWDQNGVKVHRSTMLQKWFRSRDDREREEKRALCETDENEPPKNPYADEDCDCHISPPCRRCMHEPCGD